ncbi:MAG: aquaporin [Anaerolineales bacterium]|nr:aquaporin [Anaerolineales bacterium]
MFNSKIFFAELIGTFALVFVGAGAGMAGAGLLGVALAHGLVVATFAYTFGYISGTHINPAVTLGLWANGNIKFDQALTSYWLPQLIGAAMAGFFLNLTTTYTSLNIADGATVGYLTNSSPILAVIVETILTFFLVNAIFHNAVGGKSGAFAGLVIGLTLVVSILAGGALTGASLNPARTFGIALFSNPSLTDFNTYLIYLMGPFMGSISAVLSYRLFTDADKEEAVSIEKPKRITKKASTKK